VKSAVILLVVILLWGVGLLAFAGRIARSTPPPEPPAAAGVVALTGASDARITAAMKLLETGKAHRMLISGVNPQASRADIRGVAKATRRLYDCCVDLGFQALDTVGNARETARWARKHDYRSLIVVTSDFHMPRAMLELRAALPEANLTPYPVRSGEFNARRWWRTQEGARRMIVEYCKYLAILARESLLRLGPKDHHVEPAAPDAAPSGAPA
jgi:uncharacterized SAM-binding protein YcdF (DUF218 family)